MEQNRDEIADLLFRTTYNALSSWGKVKVDEHLMRAGKINAPHNTTLPVDDPVWLRQDNERLASSNESLRQENLELWNENTELKEELMELRSELNLPDS